MTPHTTIGDVTIPTVGTNYTDYATVLAVQKALKAKGFDPKEIDGVYGPHTAAAVKSMQTKTGQAATGFIDYGVLMTLGVQAPGTSGSVAAASAASTLASATQAAHAASSLEVDSLKQQLDEAKKTLAAANTPEQKQAAQSKIEVQSAALVAQTGFWNTNIAPFNWPLWQVALGMMGVSAMGFGLYKVVKK